MGVANNVFASRYTARQVETALERAMTAVQSVNGQKPGSGGDVFFEALKLQKGDPASVEGTEVVYAASPSGEAVPDGPWSQAVPQVNQGQYLWSRITVYFNSGEPVVFYSVSRMGMDGHGSVAAVNGVSPASDGNVILTAAQVGALPLSGGAVAGPLSVPEPSRPEHAANKAYVDAVRSYAAGLRAENLLDNSDFSHPVNQRGQTSYSGNYYTLDRWFLWSQNGNARVRVDPGCVTLDPVDATALSFTQRFPKGYLGDGVYTLAYKTHDGAVHVQSDPVTHEPDLDYVGLGVTEQTSLEWMALYKGAYTAGTLPPYVPKGYGTELAECMRYYFRSWTGPTAPTEKFLSAYAPVAQNSLPVFLPVPMRIPPTVALYSPFTSTAGKIMEWESGAEIVAGPAAATEKRFYIAGPLEKGKTYLYEYEASADI